KRRAEARSRACDHGDFSCHGIDSASVRHGNGALIVEYLANALLLLRRELARLGGEVRADGKTAPYGRPCADLLEPSLEVLELVNALALGLPVQGPGIADDVGDGVLVSSDVTPVAQPHVEHAVEAISFVGETANRVGLIALTVAQPAEMPRLAELGAL